MRCSFLLFAMLAGIVSCQKKSSDAGKFFFEPPRDTLDVSKIEKFLTDSLSPAVYDSLDYSGKIVSTTDTGRTFFIRFPFRGIPIFKRFILIQVDRTGTVLKGAGFQIGENSALSVAARTVIASSTYTDGFDGNITKSWLNGQVIYSSPVVGGVIQALHPVSENSLSNDRLAVTPEIQLQSHLDACEIYHFSPEALLGPGGD